MNQLRVLFLTAAALAASAAVAALQPAEPVNINTATVEQLTELPRIGEVTATRIVEWREENGPFSSTEELMNVQGIGERTFERLRPHVTVGEPDGQESAAVRSTRPERTSPVDTRRPWFGAPVDGPTRDV